MNTNLIIRQTMSIFKELKDRKLTASDKLIFIFLSKNNNSTYSEICQQLELSLNTVKAGIKKLKECNLIEREKEGRKRGTKIVPCQSDENSIWYKNCTIFTSNYYNGTKFVPYYSNDDLLLNSNSYAMTWYKNCTILWELERKEAKERSIILLYTYSININISSINKEEGKSSLTSFASTSLKYYIEKFNFVNDLNHENLNQIQNNLTPTEPAKNDLAEIVKAPAKRKRAKKTVENFVPPSSPEEVEIFMQSYVEKAYKRYPYLLCVDIQLNADKFLAHYTMNGWKQNNKTPIVDWKAAAQKWVINQQNYIQQGSVKPKQLTLQEQQLFDSLTHNQNIDEQRFNNAVDVTEGASGASTQIQPFIREETPEEYAERQARELEEYKKKYGFTN